MTSAIYNYRGLAGIVAVVLMVFFEFTASEGNKPLALALAACIVLCNLFEIICAIAVGKHRVFRTIAWGCCTIAWVAIFHRIY
jgi:hypothetical protein